MRGFGRACVALALGLAVSAQTLPLPDRGGVPPSKLYDYGMMGPPATREIVAQALATLPPPSGAIRPEWSSIAAAWRVPAWLEQARFGIFIHWGVYAVAAHHNEWYEKHMYGVDRVWHEAHFGPIERAGYKDLIEQFRAERWRPDDWAALFQATGARFVVQAAQHHDNFALWDSRVTRFNSVAMGPRRDLVGDLAAAVRRRGMKFGLSNHGIENFTFVDPTPDLAARLKAADADLYDPAWRDFYNVADRSPEAMTRFLRDWAARNVELIDRYRPDLLWFDNGANLRVLDPLKRYVAAYYYDRARTWRKPVALVGKYVAFAPSNDDRAQVGAVVDFEKVGPRSPAGIRAGPWLVDDTIGSTWGYTEGMTVAGAPEILRRLADTAAKGGTYLLNISPRADGTIPAEQRATLSGIGRWIAVNGEAIFGAGPWRTHGEGGLDGVRFTTRPGVVYAILIGPARDVRIAALGRDRIGPVGEARCLGGASVTVDQTAQALRLRVPVAAAVAGPIVIRITLPSAASSQRQPG